MNLDLEHEFQRIMAECDREFRELGDADYCAAVRQRFLDRWYRFERFGVTSRDQLSAVTVTVKRGLEAAGLSVWGGDGTVTAETRVDVSGTPLDQRKLPRR